MTITASIYSMQRCQQLHRCRSKSESYQPPKEAGSLACTKLINRRNKRKVGKHFEEEKPKKKDKFAVVLTMMEL
jgi:hypothetical protein